VDPNSVIGDAIADAVSMSTSTTPLSSQFAENAPGSLSLLVHPAGSVRDNVDLSTQVARRVVSRHFGPQAARWFDQRIEPASGSQSLAFFGGGFDRDGVKESVVGFDVAAHQLEGVSHGLARLARIALGHLAGANVVSTMVRCGRHAGTQQITIAPAGDTPLSSLRPLMDDLGLGHQHPSLMSSAAFLLGARFTLPPGSARVTLRPIRGGVEMRLDVILEAIADPPAQLVSLLRLWMSERPRSIKGFDRWLSAFTFEGLPHAGDVTVLSVWVRPDVSARMALFLRPAALDGPSTTPSPQPHSPWD
jgi:hypothetical protein